MLQPHNTAQQRLYFIVTLIVAIGIIVTPLWLQSSLSLFQSPYTHPDSDAANNSIALSQHQPTLLFRQYAQYLSGSDGHSDISQLIDSDSNADWRSYRQHYRINRDDIDDLWLRLNIHNSGSDAIALYWVVSEATMTIADFYLLDQQGLRRHWQLGSDLPFSQRVVAQRPFVVPITVEAGDRLQLLMKVRGFSIPNTTSVMTTDAYLQWQQSKSLQHGMYYGATLLIALMVFLLYLSSRESLYLLFYLMLVGRIIYHCIRDGYAFQYLWPDSPSININVILAAVNLPLVFSILFSLTYLAIDRQRRPLAYWIAQGYLTVIIANCLISLFYVHTAIAVLTILLSYLAIPYFLGLCLLAASEIGRTPHRHRLLCFIIGWLCYLIPYTVSTFYLLLNTPFELPGWLESRHGEVLLSIALYSSLLINLRQSQMEKQQAVLESQAKSQFLATMSHELRTPLNGVIGMGELLAKTELNRIQRQYSNTIINSGKVLLNLINDILDLTKISEQKTSYEQHPFQIDQLVAEISASFVPVMQHKKLPLYIEIEAGTPFFLVGDEFRLRQVLLNLVGNAMKFTEQGRVDIYVYNESHSDDSVSLRIDVRDTGIGISAEALPYIFGSFSQADASTTRRFGGSGLGLAISQRIIEQMGGALSVDSEAEVGSCFHIELRLPVDRQRQDEFEHRLKALAGKKLLFISDDDQVFSANKNHIKHWGMQAISASDCQQAERLYRQQRADAVLCFINEQQQLEALAKHQLPLLFFSYSGDCVDDSQWQGRVINAAIPLPTTELAQALLQLFNIGARQAATPVSDYSALLNNSLEVLVVEDNPINQRVAAGMLKHFDIEADLADNGQIAVEMTATKNYDIIFMDCEMPVLDGFCASEQIQQRRSPAPFIIALTAHTYPEIEQRCQTAGMARLINKPVTLACIETVLTEYLDNR